MNLKHSVTNNGSDFFLNQGAVTVEIYNQLRNTLRNSESKKSIRNQPLIHATKIISTINIRVRNQIHASDVDQRIISLQMAQKRTPRKRKFNRTRKSLKLVCTDRQK